MQVGLTTFLLALLAGWVILRVTGKSGTEVRDPATVVRRLFLYGLLYATVVLAAQGVIELARELTDGDGRSNTALARAISFLILGIPITGLLGRYIDRRLAGSGDERRSLAWTIYLNAILATALFGLLIEGHAVLHALLAPPAEREFDAANLVAAAVWGAVWAAHWFGFRRRHGISGDLHLAIGTVIGLVPLVIGVGGMIYIGADELYNAVTNDPLTAREEPTMAYLSALAVVGAAVWAWYWWRHYRRAERTEIWYVTVVPVGALAGFVASIVGLAIAVGIAGVWFLGRPEAATAVRHFESLPVLSGVVAAGLLCWLYHRWELGPDPSRGVAIQVYHYLLAFAALVASVVGVAMLLVALFHHGPGSVANSAVYGATTVLVAGPVWAWFWARISSWVSTDASRHQDWPVRRVYLFALFGLGGLMVLISGLAVLFTTIEDALDGTLSRQTLHDDRVGLAILLTVTGVAWYHFQVYRAERVDDEPGPPDTRHRVSPQRRVILVSADHAELARHLADVSGAPVVHWQRTDEIDGPIDVGDLDQRVDDERHSSVLVVVGEDGPTVIPFVDHPVP